MVRFEHAYTAGDFGISFFIDAEGVRRDLNPDESIFACLATMPAVPVCCYVYHGQSCFE